MTVTYDPHHPQYRDEADVREELSRAFDICHGCRLCLDLCPSFPTLFSYLDAVGEKGAGQFTPAQQDHVVEGCFQCNACSEKCPYNLPTHNQSLNFSQLMLRHNAMRHENGQVGVRYRRTTRFLGSTQLVGRIATRISAVSQFVTRARPGSIVRTFTQMATGVSSVRVLPFFAQQRFSSWFNARAHPQLAVEQGSIALFPTCLVEFSAPAIGHDLVKVYERNGVNCSLVEGAGCCGVPYLHSGDVETFGKVAAQQLRVLARAVRSGRDIVVPQSVCGRVMRNEYLTHVGGDDAELVANHMFDSAEYLMKLHRAGDTALDTNFVGHVHETVAYDAGHDHTSQNIPTSSEELIVLTGAGIEPIQLGSGLDSVWGFRSENNHHVDPLAARLIDVMDQVTSPTVASDCHLTTMAIFEFTGRVAVHPMQIVARAYGIAEEPTP